MQARLKWNIQQPERAGYYYFRPNDQREKEVVYVGMDPEAEAGEPLTVYYDGGNEDWIINWRGQWAGPLPEPAE